MNRSKKPVTVRTDGHDENFAIWLRSRKNNNKRNNCITRIAPIFVCEESFAFVN